MKHGFFLAFAAALSIAASIATAQAESAHGDEAHSAHDMESEAHSFTAHGLKVVHPWLNATTGTEALIYMTIENEGQKTVTIEGAETHFAESASLVGFVLEDGEDAFEPIDSVPVRPGRHLELGPQSLALRASGLKQHLEEGTSVRFTLETSEGAIAVIAVVEAADARQHSHAGHAH